MTFSVRSLPARPSLDWLRKQAKSLVRAVGAGDADAVARVRAQLGAFTPPLALRDAQLVLAREHGFAGWRELKAEVLKRSDGLEWAALEAERAIHDNDVNQLKTLLADHPALLGFRGEDGETLLSAAVSSFGDSGHPEREQAFTRPACAELLIDAGALVDPKLWRDVVTSRADGMLHLLWRKGVLPDNLVVRAALGDLAAVQAQMNDASDETLDEALLRAARFGRTPTAEALLDARIARDPTLGKRIDGGPGRPGFVAYLAEHPDDFGAPWRTYAVNELMHAIEARDLAAFRRMLRADPDLLGPSSIGLQVQLIERAVFTRRNRFVEALLDLNPAVLRSDPPPPSQALTFAFEYGCARFVPLLTRIWPLPDDLPHAAGSGDLARVRRWFDAEGRPALGDLSKHYPATNSVAVRRNLHWRLVTVQRVLDTALAWACMNKELEVAEFLVAHGADVNTDWSTHEPASILHECAMSANYEAAQFLIDHGADLSRLDHRWNATPAGWAIYAAKDEAMGRFLMEAQAKQGDDSGARLG